MSCIILPVTTNTQTFILRFLFSLWCWNLEVFCSRFLLSFSIIRNTLFEKLEMFKLNLRKKTRSGYLNF